MKKGTKVYEFVNWDGKGTFAYRVRIVASMGKRQGTLVDVASGEPVEYRIYARSYGNLLPVADCANPNAEALRRAAAFIPEERARIEQCIARNSDNVAYKNAMIADLGKLHEPRALAQGAAQ